MAGAISLSNPSSIHAPLGAYTHGITVAAGPGVRTLYVSGQVGVRPDGSVCAGAAEQAEQAFRNLGTILSANDFEFGDLVRLTTYIVQGQSGAAVLGVRRNFLGTHRPASTALYVAELLSPDWLVEIEAMAVRQAD
jgi:2-iminobutanoate/2-iminopropanoate deaminase